MLAIRLPVKAMCAVKDKPGRNGTKSDAEPGAGGLGQLPAVDNLSVTAGFTRSVEK